jgi:hypothetical protein
LAVLEAGHEGVGEDGIEEGGEPGEDEEFEGEHNDGDIARSCIVEQERVRVFRLSKAVGT